MIQILFKDSPGKRKRTISEGGKETRISEGGKETRISEGGKETRISEGGKETRISEGGKETRICEGGKETRIRKYDACVTGLGLWCMNSRSRKIRRNHERISSPPAQRVK